MSLDELLVTKPYLGIKNYPKICEKLKFSIGNAQKLIFYAIEVKNKGVSTSPQRSTSPHLTVHKIGH